MLTVTNTPYEVGSILKLKVDGQIIEAPYIGEYRGCAVFKVNGKNIVRKYDRIKNLNATPATRSNIEVIEEAAPAIDEADAIIAKAKDVNVRFKYIQNLVDMVVYGDANSMIVTGPGGLGKTHTIIDRLKFHDLGEPGQSNEITEIKGHATPKSMYNHLYHNNGKITVFDDCDSVLKEPTCVNLLKGALDTHNCRRISWLTTSDRDGGGVPDCFEFTGRIIFLSNMSIDNVPQPILSRAFYVDLAMTPEEKITRIDTIKMNLVEGITTEVADDCVALLDTLKFRISDLNLRTFQKVAKLRMSQPTNWREMAIYMTTARK